MNNYFRLSDQAVGAFMMLLQKGILERVDMVSIFKELDIEEVDGKLFVKNPPTFEIKERIPEFPEGSDGLEWTMPIYNYWCSFCKEDKEYFLQMKEKKIICDQCGNQTLEKKIITSLSTINKKSDGTITKKNIEQNRELLKMQKEELMSKRIKDDRE